jgi:CBS-domain-containing membrane protein
MVTAPVITIRPEDDLALASQVMLWAGIRHLPVVREGVVVGVLSGGDILRHEAKVGGREGARARIAEAMSSPAEVIDMEADLSEAAARMLDGGIGCLPVVQGNRLRGIITSADILGYQARRRVPGSSWPAQARDVMTVAPMVAEDNEDLLEAVALMLKLGVRHLPVVDSEGRVVGMLSDRDVRSAVGDPSELALSDEEAPERLRTMKVSQAMSAPALTVRQEEPLAAVTRHFLDWRVGALPVLDDQDKVVGIISYLDMLDRVYAHFSTAGRAGGEAAAAPR